MSTDPNFKGRARMKGIREAAAMAFALLVWGSNAHGNDDFANAINLSGSLPLNSATVSTVGTTAESGEPDHDFNSISSRSIWYSWTAPSAMAVEINTFGSTPTIPTPGLQFDTVMAVYTGNSVGSLTRIVGNDDTEDTVNGTTKQSRVRFIALAGTTYRIAIDGFQGDTGNAELNILAFTATRPGNDDWINAEEITGALPQENDQSSGSTTASNVNGTTEHGEPEHIDEGAFSSSVWYKWTSPTSGAVAAHTTGSSFDTVLAAYRGTSITGLTLITQNDDNSAGSQSSLEFFAEIGVEYYFAVDGFDNEEGDVQFLLQWGPNPPANDDLADAQILPTANTVSINGPSGGSTAQLTEPEHALGHPATSSVWYSWTAPVDVAPSVEINTFGSNFDTVLAVYTGTNFGNLNQLTSNDDAGLPQSRVRFTPSAGVTYLIAVDGRLGAQGAVFVNVQPGPTPPANNDFVDAEDLGQNSFVFASGNNFGASIESGEPTHFTGVTSDGSVWYVWTAHADSDVKVSTANSTFDTTIAVYSGSVLNSLFKLRANDNAGGLQSQLIFPATLGETYYIAVAGKNSAEGDIELEVSAVGSFAQWLEDWPSLTGDDRKHDADKDGDGFPNAVEMICGLNPILNSWPGGADPNAANTPVLDLSGSSGSDIRLLFSIDPTYANVSHNNGAPVTFRGKVWFANMVPVALRGAPLVSGNQYQIETNFLGFEGYYFALEVFDPNAGN